MYEKRWVWLKLRVFWGGGQWWRKFPHFLASLRVWVLKWNIFCRTSSRNVKRMILSIHSTCIMHLLHARNLGKWPTSHSSLLKNKTTLGPHHHTCSTLIILIFSLLFSERQTKRKMNKLWFAMDSRKNILEVAPGPSTDSAKSVCFSLETAQGKDAGRQLSN